MSAVRWSTGTPPSPQSAGCAVTRDEGESVTRDATIAKEPHERGDPIMTAAQRQRAYRLRRKRAVIDAIGEEASASRVTLLAMLGRDLAMLDDERDMRMHSALHSSAQRILRVLVTRYGIDLADPS